MQYILMEYADKANYTASSKARDDIVSILKKTGAKYIPLFQAKSGHIKIAGRIIKACIYLSYIVKKNDVIYIQYPYNPQIINKLLISGLSWVSKYKKAKLCVIIHDVNSFRYTVDEAREEKLNEEASLLNKANFVIAHNSKMIDLLQKHGLATNVGNLQYFDYLYNGPKSSNDKYHNTVIVAGNLTPEKSGYVYSLPNQSVQFALYGVNYNSDLQQRENVRYFGAYPPDELIEHMHGSYGLVWDGPSPEACEGNFGTYLKYNDPHKFSLYIAAGIPVIVWKESALADTVEKLEIGLAVRRLQDIDDIIKRVSESDYNNMLLNVNRESERVCSGKMLISALERMAL